MKKMINKAVAKSKPGVSPNPMVTGGMARPTAGGPLGGIPKPTPAQQKMVAKKVNPAARAQPLSRAGTVASKMGRIATVMPPKPSTTVTRKPPGPVKPSGPVRSTAKPAMPARKK
jgi:hypothetical protein